MIQPKDEPLSADFDDIAESPLKCPKLEKIKEVIVDSTSVIPWIESPQSETCDPLGCNEDEYHPDQEEVSQDVSEYKVTIKPKEEPPYLEFEAIIEEPELGVKVEQSEKEIDDSLLHRLDTKFTSPCVDSSSSETHDDTNSSRSITLFTKFFDAISEDEAHKVVDKHTCKPSKVMMQSLEKIRVESPNQFRHKGSDEVAEKSKTGDTVPGITASDNDFLFKCLTAEFHDTHCSYALFRFDEKNTEKFSNSHDAVTNWCNNTLENLASGWKAISRVNLGQKSITVPTTKNSSINALIDVTIVEGSFVYVDPNNINGSSNSKFNLAHPTSTSKARPDTYVENRDTDRFFCLLWGREKIWILLRPEHEWTLQSKLYEMLGRLRTTPWKPDLDLPSHPKELLVKPAQLESWGVPYKIVVQRPGDLLYLSDRVVLYTLDVGPNIGASLKIRHSCIDSVNQNNGQKVTSRGLNMPYIMEAIRAVIGFDDLKKQPFHNTCLLQESKPKPTAVYRQSHLKRCGICDKHFSDVMDLIQHMRSVHKMQSKNWPSHQRSIILDSKHSPFHDQVGKLPLSCDSVRANSQDGLERNTHRLSYTGVVLPTNSLKNATLTKVRSPIVPNVSILKPICVKSSEPLAPSAMVFNCTKESSSENATTECQKSPTLKTLATKQNSKSTNLPDKLEKMLEPSVLQSLAPSKHPFKAISNKCLDMCQPTYSSPGRIRQEKLLPQNPPVCKICSINFIEHSALESHIRDVHPLMPEKVDRCSKSSDHDYISRNEIVCLKPRACSSWGRPDSPNGTKFKRRKYPRGVTEPNEDSVEKTIFPINRVSLKSPKSSETLKETLPLICQLCPERFNRSFALIRHMRNVHKLKVDKEPCPGCSESYDRKYLPIHKLVCKTLRRCRPCGRSFTTGPGFESHIQSCRGINTIKYEDHDKGSLLIKKDS